MSRILTVLQLSLCLAMLPAGFAVHAQVFKLPTVNTALFEPGGEDRFFAATPGKPASSGTFGCVRSGGWQMHEGLDIRAVKRDKHNEPSDTVMASMEGQVAYFSINPALSNYGRYVVLRHRVEGLEVYTLYAHLAAIQPGLKVGQNVKAGDAIGLMGRSTNTRTAITKDRAHVHFEINFFATDHFQKWYDTHVTSAKNDHGPWNGHNLIGVDPRLVLLGQAKEGAKFSFLRFIQTQTELFRASVRVKDFGFLKRYPQLIALNPRCQTEGVAGYEISFNYNGLPFRIVPRSPAELKPGPKFELLQANAAEYEKNPCRRLVKKKGTQFELGGNGRELLQLLTD